MNGEIRRSEILQKLQTSGRAISGSALAKTFGVSRQVIVQDIALLRAQGIHITPTNRGYLLERSTGRATRVFKVIHTEEEVEDELTRIVDLGGTIKDVFIYHRVYGVVRGELNIRSRLDVSHYMAEMHGGKSRLLSCRGNDWNSICFLSFFAQKCRKKDFLFFSFNFNRR